MARAIQVGDTQVSFSLWCDCIRIYIKGEEGNQCVLATDSKSYAIEKINTSNTVLLCKKMGENEYSVKGTTATILEVGGDADIPI